MFTLENHLIGFLKVILSCLFTNPRIDFEEDSVLFELKISASADAVSLLKFLRK